MAEKVYVWVVIEEYEDTYGDSFSSVDAVFMTQVLAENYRAKVSKGYYSYRIKKVELRGI